MQNFTEVLARLASKRQSLVAKQARIEGKIAAVDADVEKVKRQHEKDEAKKA